MIQPNITHLPCDLDQQRKRQDAFKDSVARAVAWRLGKRSFLDRVLRRSSPDVELSAERLRRRDGEDVYHAFGI